MARILLILLWYITAGASYAQAQQAPPYSRDRLLQAIAQYQALAEEGNWHFLPDTLLLQPGDSSQYVLPLYANLHLTGDLPPAAGTASVLYTKAITAAVRNFQRRHGLMADGVLGPHTVAALNVPPSYRLWQLQQNLIRWDTTFTDVQQPYVVVNIPDYTLQVIDSSLTVLQMRVIVGKPRLKTYPVRSKLTTVVLHPYWYLPTTIAVNEIVPLLRRNPGYLQRKHMKLEKPSGEGWVLVNPWRVNWQNVNSNNFNYRIVQLDGDNNELGQVKFPFPNSIAQYLHDTPNKEFFRYPNRAFSHGCIRLEKPLEFAYYLLERGSGYTTEKVDRLWKKPKPNHYLPVLQPLPLYIVYLTAWADAQSGVQFRNDIYGFDVMPQLTGTLKKH